MRDGAAGRERAEAVPGRAWRAAQAVLGLLLLFIVAVNVLNAAGRHVLGAGILGADELMVFTMIWIVFAGAILAMLARDHIAVELLPDQLPPRGRAVFHVLHDLIALAACSYAAWVSWNYVEQIARIGMRSMALGVPLHLAHSALLAGYAGLALAAAWVLYRDLGRFLRLGTADGRPA